MSFREEQFRLKKDLPFAKAGTIIDKIRSSSGTEELSFIQIGKCKCQIPGGVNIFDWIEKIKPRRFVIVLDAQGKPYELLQPSKIYSGDFTFIDTVEC